MNEAASEKGEETTTRLLRLPRSLLDDLAADRDEVETKLLRMPSSSRTHHGAASALLFFDFFVA